MLASRFPPLRLLLVFETFLRTGTTQRAAAELNVTQPAISQALKSLESFVGTPLLDRSRRPPVLTEAGRILQSGITDSFGRISLALDQVSELKAGAAKAVTIACSAGTATYWLMPRLANFYGSHPDVAVNVLTTEGAPEFQGNADLLIRYGLGDWADGTSIKLFAEEVVPVCSPSIVDKIKGKRGLQSATLLHVKSREASWLGWEDYLSLHAMGANKEVGRHFTNYVQATQAALQGQGVILGWKSNTADLLKEGRLVTFGAPQYKPKEAFYLVQKASSRPRAAVKQIADWLISVAKASTR